MPNGQDGKHKLLIECPVAQHPDIFTKINGSIEALERTIAAVEHKAAEATALVNKKVMSAENKAEHAEESADTAVEVAKTANTKVDFFYKFLIGLAGLSSTVAILWHLFFGV